MSENPPDFKSTRRQRQNLVDLSKIDRLPPYSLEAEQGALGCCLLAPNESLGLCEEHLPGDVLSFYDLRHRTLYGVLVKMYKERQAMDLITVSQRLRDLHQLEAIGGLAYLSELQDCTPSAANLGYYLAILRDRHTLRSLLAACTEIAAKVYETPDTGAQSLASEAEEQIRKVSAGQQKKRRVPIKDLIRGAIDRIQEYHARPGATVGLATGIADFDSLTGGLKPANVYVFAARPSAGKTSLGMNIAEYVATKEGVAVGIFSLEMSADELAIRFLCSSAKVNSRSAERGYLSEGDFRRLTAASSAISKSKLHIDDTASLTVSQFRAEARRMHTQDGCRLFVIDYLQKMKGSSRHFNSREQEVAEISAGIKAVAKELKVPVVVLAQLNRDIERDKGRKPRLSDLRESGAIEQDADLVVMLHRPDEDEGAENSAVEVRLVIAKHRNGPSGEIPLTFVKAFTRFESQSKIQM